MVRPLILSLNFLGLIKFSKKLKFESLKYDLAKFWELGTIRVVKRICKKNIITENLRKKLFYTNGF